MASSRDQGSVIVTGSGGHIGREVCRLLRASKPRSLPVDVDPGITKDWRGFDFTRKNHVSRLFRSHPVRAVIHLAAILPSAFHSNPFAGVDVNLNGCFELIRQAVNAKVKRFVFASSMSVYGSSLTPRALTEEDPAAPDEPYGASKRAVELVGETLASPQALDFLPSRTPTPICTSPQPIPSPPSPHTSA